MTALEHAQSYVANPRFIREDWHEVSDSPELTEEDFARAKPLEEGAPDLAAAIRRTRNERAATADEAMVRLAPRVVAHFKATGEGWQERVNAILLKAAGL